MPSQVILATNVGNSETYPANTANTITVAIIIYHGKVINLTQSITYMCRGANK